MAARRRLKTQDTPPPVEQPEYEAAPEAKAAPEPVVVRKSIPRAKLHTAEAPMREPQHAAEHTAPRRTRRRKADNSEDMFYFPLDQIPEGSSYEWKRWTVKGEEDPYYIAQMREQGWEPVDPKRHLNLLPPGYSAAHVIKHGMILMERPIELTKEARAEQRMLAKRQVIEAEQRLGMTPKDTGTRALAEVAPRVVKEVGRMVAIED